MPLLKSYPEVDLDVVAPGASSPTQADLIFALGGNSLEFFQHIGVVPKNRTLTSLRGREFTVYVQEKPTPVMFSYSLGLRELDHAKGVDLVVDAQMAVRRLATGTLEPKMGDYRYVQDFSELIQYIESQPGIVDVGFDTETIGFDEYRLPEGDHPGAYLVSLQFSAKPGTADVRRFTSRAEEEQMLSDGSPLRQQVEYLLNSPKVSLRGANLKFDLRWMWVRARLRCTNFKFDTTLVGSLLDENRSNGLEVHAKLYTPLGGYSDVLDREVDKSRMDLVPPEKLLPYAGGDADAVLQVASAMKPLLIEAGMAPFYVNVLHPAVRAFEDVENTGVLINVEKAQKLVEDMQAEILRLIDKGKKIIGGRLAAKHYDSTKPGGINFSKPGLIKDFMFTSMGLNLRPVMWADGGSKGDKQPSTSQDHLNEFVGHPEAKLFVEFMNEYSGTTKALSTHVLGFLECVRSDGRLHPRYFFFVGNKDSDEGGTNTGRLSCKDPAFQTLPAHTKWAKRIRECYEAPPGYLILANDYVQGELKVIACIAGEQNMIRAYQKGMDLHVITSSSVAGLTYDEMIALKKQDKGKYDSIRQLGKAGNFGLIYGMQPPGFVNYAKWNYGVDLTVQQATEFHGMFFEKWPGLVQYHEHQKRFARQHGYVFSPLGRIRHLPNIRSRDNGLRSKDERRSVNAPTQATLSDMMIWAIAMSKSEGWNEIAPCFGAIHDASYRYVPENDADKYVKLSKDTMENLPFEKVGWQPQLKFTADAKIGPNLADLKEV